LKSCEARFNSSPKLATFFAGDSRRFRAAANLPVWTFASQDELHVDLFNITFNSIASILLEIEM
jgi:hypothetical protein